MKEIEKLKFVIESLRKTVEKDKKIIENLRRENLLSKERYKYLSKEIENLTIVYEKAGKKILEMLDERIGMFSVELDNFNKQLISIRKEIALLNTKIEKLRNYISSVDSFQTNLQAKISEMEKIFSKRFIDVKKLKGITSDLEKNLANLETSVKDEISKISQKISYLLEMYQSNRRNINEVLRIGEELKIKMKEMERLPLQLVEDTRKINEELRERMEKEVNELEDKFSKQIESLSMNTFKQKDGEKLFGRLVEVEGKISSLEKGFKNFEERERKFFASYDLKLENFSGRIASLLELEKRFEIAMERIKALERRMGRISSMEVLTNVLDETSQNLVVRVSRIEKMLEKLGKRMKHIDSLSQGFSEKLDRFEVHERKMDELRKKVNRLENSFDEVLKSKDKFKLYLKELRSLFSLVNDSLSELKKHAEFIAKNMPKIAEKIEESEKLEIGVKRLLERLK